LIAGARHPEARAQATVLVVRPEAPLFFANAEQTMITVRELAEARVDSVHRLALRDDAAHRLRACVEAFAARRIELERIVGFREGRELREGEAAG